MDAPSDITAGDTFTVIIKAQNATNLFGLSFKLNYSEGDYITVNTPTSASVTAGDFLGSDIIFYPSVDESADEISIGMSRKAGQDNVNGNGTLAEITFKSSPDTPDGTLVTFEISGITGNDKDSETLTITASNGSSIVIAGTEVWPGDTNNDGVVTAADVLPLGFFWNKTGPGRANASNRWEAQPCSSWDPVAATYADASGNGKVDQIEITLIGLHWEKHILCLRLLQRMQCQITETMKFKAISVQFFYNRGQAPPAMSMLLTLPSITYIRYLD